MQHDPSDPALSSWGNRCHSVGGSVSVGWGLADFRMRGEGYWVVCAKRYAMNDRYFGCRRLKKYVDAGYRWAYWRLENPGIVSLGQPVSLPSVLNAIDYWNPLLDDRSKWLVDEILPRVKLFIEQHSDHELLYIEQDMVFDPEGPCADWIEEMKIREKSHAAYQQAKELMPGGVNSPARAFGGVGGEPIFFARGEGAYLIDVDGNRYIDYVGSWGPLILGHAHPQVVEAVRAAAERGTSFGVPTEAESELCELIIQAVPSVETVRLVNSGRKRQ